MAACGGGSDDHAVDEAAPVPALAAAATPAIAPELATAPAAATEPAPAPAPDRASPRASDNSAAATEPVLTAPATSASCEMDGTAVLAAEVLQRVNMLRASGMVCGSIVYPATAALNWNSLLQQAAAAHSNDMAQNNYFSHVSLDARTLADRMAASGYGFTAAGENIGAGQATVQEVVGRWIQSPGHCQNLMNPAYRDIGLACRRNDSAAYQLYWTLNLGRN